MKYARAAVMAAALSVPAPGWATVIVSVGNADQAETINIGQARATSFTLANPETHVTVGAPITCLGCNGGVWLQKDAIGPSASFAGALGAIALGSTVTPYFTIDTLTAGTYFLIVSVASTSSIGAIWSGSDAPIVTTAYGAGRGVDFLAATTQPFVPFSTFGVTFGTGLNITVAADAQTVPEPASLMLLAPVIVGLGLTRRRERAAVAQ